MKFSQNELPSISAKCWAAFNGITNEYIFGKMPNKQVEIASLTKILTCFLALTFLERRSLDPKEIKVQISKLAYK